MEVKPLTQEDWAMLIDLLKQSTFTGAHARKVANLLDKLEALQKQGEAEEK